MLRGRLPNPAFSLICGVFAALAALAALLAGPLTADAKTLAPPDYDDCRQTPWERIALERTSMLGEQPMRERGRAGGDGGVTLAFLPGPARSPLPLMLRDFDSLPGFSRGLVSPTLGRYSPVQEMLDISQGSRVASALYKPSAPSEPGLLVSRELQAGRIVGWNRLRARADAVPGEVVPGLLARSMIDGGSPVSFVGFGGGSNLPAIAGAAASCGYVQGVSLGSRATFAQRVVERAGAPGLTVASLPPGAAGLAVVRKLVEAEPRRMLIVLQAPPEPARVRLMPIAIHGLGGEGGMKSPTTRRDGLVAATDIAPTILERLGIERPGEMDGRPIEPASPMDADALQSMSNRLSVIQARRQSFGRNAVTMLGLILLGVLLLAHFAGHLESQARLAMRLVALAMLWLPSLLLVTASLRPTAAAELNIAVAGALLLSLATDKLLRWPRAPVVPVAVMLVAYAWDFAIGGSNLTGQSLLGSNPFYGARFFGAGNELEVTFVVTTLFGLGALLCWRRIDRPGLAFALAGAVLAMFLGAGKLGADVGGVIMVAGGFGAAALYAAERRLDLKSLAMLIALPLLALVVIVVIDNLTGGQSHLTRTVLKAESPGELIDVAVRRFSASVNGAMVDRVWVLVLFAAGLLSWAWIKRAALLAPLRHAGQDLRPLEAGLYGGLAATLVGTLANDSGPAILLIGTIYLGVGVLYVRGRPVARAAAVEAAQPARTAPRSASI
jgi:hypothetical protein